MLVDSASSAVSGGTGMIGRSSLSVVVGLAALALAPSVGADGSIYIRPGSWLVSGFSVTTTTGMIFFGGSRSLRYRRHGLCLQGR